MKTYRDHFADEKKAAEYDSQQYRAGSYGEAIWQIEQMQLAALVKRFRQSHPQIDYLDFAAGTGRLVSFMEGLVDTSTAIEISESMLAVARTKTKKTRLICTDITAPDAALEGRYDLITAFRFVLNAEPSLRISALKALGARLKDSDSRLIFNNHGNTFSHKLLSLPVYKYRHWRCGYMPEGNQLSHGQVKRMAAEAGLAIESRWGSGLLSSKALRLMSYDRICRIEERVSGIRLLTKLGVNQMYVARPL